MQQIQTLIDRIRVAMADERIESSPEMQELAREFHSLSRKLNERLRRCGEYLRQGLRAEAIQEAETEPPLLEAVGVVQSLSDDERLTWVELAQFLELPTPEPVLFDVAEMIEEAYSEHAPLEKLLRANRKLALQRAPLPQRLALLRQIGREDPNSDFWRTDIRAYEEVRLSQITQELRGLTRRGASVAEIQDLVGEVQGTGWSIPIPGKLLPSLQTQLREAVRMDARERIEEVAGQLHAAFGAMDFAKALPIYQQWQKLLPQAELSDDAPIVLKSLAAISWCRQQIANDAADAAWGDHLHDIERALVREPVSEEELRKLSDRTTRHQRPLPPAVESRLTGRITAFETQRRRKKLMIVGSATAATLALVAAIVLIISKVQDNSLRSQIYARINEQVDAGQLAEAQETLKKYEPSWGTRADWPEVAEKVGTLAKSFQSRTEQVELLLQRAATIPETDPAGFQKVTTEAVSLASSQPVLADLKHTVDLRVQKLEIERSGRLKTREEELMTRLTGQAKQVEELRKTFGELEAAEFDGRRGRIRDGLTSLASELAGMAPRLADQHKFLLSEVDDIEKQFTRRQRRAELLGDLKTRSRIRPSTSSLDDVGKFVATLSQFTAALENDPLTPGMKRAVAEAPAWQSVFALRDLPADSGRLFPASMDLIEARRKEVDELLKTYPQTPLRGTLEKYLGVLAVLERRHKPASGLIPQITSDILEAEHMRDLFVLKDTALPWPYYVLSRDPLPKEEIITFTRWSVMEKPEEVKILPKSLVNLKPSVAPQAALVEQIRTSLKGLDAETWDATMNQVVRSVLDDGQVDPILRLQLLSTLCTLAKAGSLSAPTHKPFLDFETKMTSAVERINLLADWADPKNSDVKERREKCLDYFKEISTLDFAKVWPPPASVFKDLKAEFSVPYSTVGWMTRGDDGKPMLDLTVPTGSWTLLVCIPGTGEKEPGRFEVLGRHERGELHLAPSATSSSFVPGRLVFARPLVTAALPPAAMSSQP